MHKEILSKEQTELLPLIKLFSKDYYMVGGTAIALYLGHRRSIDFDLFTSKDIKRKSIKRIIEINNYLIEDLLFEDYEQLHIMVNSVKITFFNYPFNIPTPVYFEKIIMIPDLIDLAAMKTLALGGSAKWKDYVDLYFLLKNHVRLNDISVRAKKLFGTSFNEKLFREQLSYFKDIDYTEKIEFVNQEVDEEDIRTFLTEIAVSPF